MKYKHIFLLFILVAQDFPAQTYKPEFDNSRGRFAIGGGGALAFKTLGGYNARAYIHFSPYWKLAFSGTRMFKYDSVSTKTLSEWGFDVSLLHPIKVYKETDVLYLFEGITASQWERNKSPKGKFRRYDHIAQADTTIFLGGIHMGAGFEKPIGPIAFFSELKVTIGAPNWLMATIGLKTNFGQIFRDPKKRYDLNTVDEFQ